MKKKKTNKQSIKQKEGNRLKRLQAPITDINHYIVTNQKTNKTWNKQTEKKTNKQLIKQKQGIGFERLQAPITDINHQLQTSKQIKH